eukprot:Em0360g3a
MRILTRYRSHVQALVRRRCIASFKHQGITIARNEQPKPKPDPATLVFGKEFHGSHAHGEVGRFERCIEGMKAYRGIDGKVRLFRPLENIRETEQICCSGVPALGPYFRKFKHDSTPSVFSAVTLFATSQYVEGVARGRWRPQAGIDYGPTIRVQKIAESKGCNQVLWLLGKEEQGTHTVKERSITMADVKRGGDREQDEGDVGSGTACVICPISKILHSDEVSDTCMYIPLDI